MTELCDLTISDIRCGLDSKEFTSVELTEKLLERIDKFRDLNTFIKVCSESALASARKADLLLQKGNSSPLLGIPIAVKDVILTKDIESTCASKILEGFIPPYDATVTQKLIDSGYILIGKTNMDEFAMGSSNENSAFGPAKNPWNQDHVPGGSSGGSAAAVSSRLVPAALGTDTGGSIRQPASYCGVVGLKPTYGRVSRYGVIAFASSLDQVGALTRNVRDCAVLTQIISGWDPNDSTSVRQEVPNFNALLGKDIKGIKVGIPREYFVEGLDPEVEKTVRAAISELSGLGAKVVDISLPHTSAAIATYYIIAPAEASSNLSRYDGIRYQRRAENPRDLMDLYCRSRSEGFGAEVQRRILIGTYVLSSGYYDAYYLRAQKVRKLIATDFQNAFEKECDIIACPTAPTPAFRLGENTEDPLAMYLNDIFTVPTSLAGLPALSIPCGFASSGLPIGMQLIGKPWDEETLLQTAYAYENSTNLNFKVPI
jgi:aspartyl-tRNA(Asn)/glutamyl-tRNA(Gln) amidotransferase subunit A